MRVPHCPKCEQRLGDIYAYPQARITKLVIRDTSDVFSDVAKVLPSEAVEFFEKYLRCIPAEHRTYGVLMSQLMTGSELKDYLDFLKDITGKQTRRAQITDPKQLPKGLELYFMGSEFIGKNPRVVRGKNVVMRLERGERGATLLAGIDPNRFGGHSELVDMAYIAYQGSLNR